MFYKCPDCGKITDGYTNICPECGSKIEMTDSVSDAEVRNMENAEKNEEKFELFRKRVKYGYIVMAVYFVVALAVILPVAILSRISAELFAVLLPVLLIVLAIILVIIIKKCKFFCCPHCDCMMKSYNALHSLCCPYCGKRIRDKF